MGFLVRILGLLGVPLCTPKGFDDRGFRSSAASQKAVWGSFQSGVGLSPLKGVGVDARQVRAGPTPPTGPGDAAPDSCKQACGKGFRRLNEEGFGTHIPKHTHAHRDLEIAYAYVCNYACICIKDVCMYVYIYMYVRTYACMHACMSELLCMQCYVVLCM